MTPPSRAPRGAGASSAPCEWPADPAPSPDEFARRVRAAGREHARDGLPWRFVDDPYAVLVSEVMLQQTQVARVIGRWDRFLRRFPTVDALAAADAGAVLEEWQGLGYNRRALALKRAAEACAHDRAGELPRTAEELERLPGIGPATAAGVVAFAYNRPAVYLETNVRAVFLHELFPGRDGVKDAEIASLVRETCPDDDPRSWYYALLDYGAYLKKSTANPSRRSASYAKQSAFEGSRRQKRAELLRIVLGAGSVPAGEALSALDEFERAHGRGAVDPALFDSIVRDMVGEGFFSHEDGVLRSQ